MDAYTREEDQKMDWPDLVCAATLGVPITITIVALLMLGLLLTAVVRLFWLVMMIAQIIWLALAQDSP